MDWIDFISNLRYQMPEQKAVVCPPASDAALEEFKTAFGWSSLPRDLEELYRQTNGVEEWMGSEKIGTLIWSVEEAALENRRHRQWELPGKRESGAADGLLFAGAGNGDAFVFLMGNAGDSESAAIHVWDHEDGSLTAIAPDLKTFLYGWVTGKITV